MQTPGYQGNANGDDTQPRTSSTFEQTSKPGLLSLPPELRICIYELVIKLQRQVKLAPGMRLPPLLSTRRQVQNEAYPVWLSANTFTISICHCDDSFLHRFATAANLYNLTPCVRIHLLGFANWRNLLVWCRRLWERQSLMCKKYEGMDCSQPVVDTAHRIVQQHSGKSWNQCRQALDNMASRANVEWFTRQRFVTAPKSVET